MDNTIKFIEDSTEKEMSQYNGIHKEENIQNDGDFQKTLKRLGLENKKLESKDFSIIFRYLQEIYCLGS